MDAEIDVKKQELDAEYEAAKALAEETGEAHPGPDPGTGTGTGTDPGPEP